MAFSFKLNSLWVTEMLWYLEMKSSVCSTSIQQGLDHSIIFTDAVYCLLHGTTLGEH
jgi:hypothetical protein